MDTEEGEPSLRERYDPSSPMRRSRETVLIKKTRQRARVIGAFDEVASGLEA